MNRQIGQTLLEEGAISADQLRIAIQEQEKSWLPLGKLLVSLGFISEVTLRETLSESFGTQSIDLTHCTIDPSCLQYVPDSFARRHHLLPIAFDEQKRRLILAMADSSNLPLVDRVRALFDQPIELDIRIAGESDLERAIDRYYGHTLSIDGILEEIETGKTEAISSNLRHDDYRQPVVRLIDALLTDAVKRGASDIHFEPEPRFLRIRYRIDGQLRQIRALHKTYWPAMTVRLKVLSGMNIAETRTPQDGRISLNVSGHAIDFRAASQPTLHGENFVLRILDRQKGIVPLDALGLSAKHLQQLHKMIARPEGILLVTGPTGSGKTTTLYSILNHLNDERIHIMTLEDPVEYPLPMARQTSIAESAKLDFANGIRSMMRQDPDIILVGEIRDTETADMAFRAALTGHQVFSTLHSNSALGAIPRLLDIGIQPDIMAGNIIGIIAQRLVRELCAYCKLPYLASPEEKHLLGLQADASPTEIYRASGCPECAYQGYRGRLALMEVLRLTTGLDELIAARAPLHEIKKLAVQQGLITLAEDGFRQVLEGRTSIEELGRVIDLSSQN
jgi:general secretion pathway protein E/type IV pilus assembly protein PilB